MLTFLLATLGMGGVLRYLLSETMFDSLLTLKEFSTPNSNWQNVIEGVRLYKFGISPYDGDIFHESPLFLRFITYLLHRFPGCDSYLFIIVDLATAIILYKIAGLYGHYMLKKQYESLKNYHADAKSNIIKADYLQNIQLFIWLFYLFNPYTIFCCASKSTALFQNFLIVLIIYCMLLKKLTFCCFVLALSIYQSFYSVIFLVSVICNFSSLTSFYSSRNVALECILKTGLFVSGLLILSYLCEGSWNFLYSTYGFNLSVSDLSPNIGLFWYFFTEMFDHFHIFFVWVFQLNLFVYIFPLTLKLKHDPVFLFFIFLGLISIFKPYPSYSDSAIVLSLLPLWAFTAKYLRNSLVVVCMYITCAMMLPLMYYLWIYHGSANANFYFAITLVFATAQIFLITDLLFAYLLREFHLLEGDKLKLENGKDAIFILQ